MATTDHPLSELLYGARCDRPLIDDLRAQSGIEVTEVTPLWKDIYVLVDGRARPDPEPSDFSSR